MVHVEYNFPEKVMEKIKKLLETGEYEEEKDIIIRGINNLFERSSGAYKELEEQALELKKEAKVLKMHGDYLEKEVKNFLKEANVSLEHPTGFDLCVVPTTEELYGITNKDLIWTFYNRFFPIKTILMQFVVYSIEHQKIEQRENILMEDFIVELEEQIKEFVKRLIKTEQINVAKMLIGFPQTKEKFLESPKVRKIRNKRKKEEKAEQLEKTSMNRFISQFFGRVLANKPNMPTRIAGACFEMNLVEGWERSDKMIEIRLTELGKHFASLKNPVLERIKKGEKFDDISQKYFSCEERDFILKEIISKFPLENNVIKRYFKFEKMTVKKIYEEFKDEQEIHLEVKNDKDRLEYGLVEKDKDKKSENFNKIVPNKNIKIQSGTIMKRLEELGLFKRIQIGKNVEYVKIPIK